MIDRPEEELDDDVRGLTWVLSRGLLAGLDSGELLPPEAGGDFTQVVDAVRAVAETAVLQCRA